MRSGFLIDHMLCRKGHCWLISKWTLSLVNALNHHWCVKPAAYYLKLFWIIWCPEISFLRILYMGQNLYPTKNKIIDTIVSYLIFAMFLQRKLQHVDHKWVICGSHLDYSVVKWVNRCDIVSTLIFAIATLYVNILLTITYVWYYSSYSYLLILH